MSILPKQCVNVMLEIPTKKLMPFTVSARNYYEVDIENPPPFRRFNNTACCVFYSATVLIVPLFGSLIVGYLYIYN